MNLPSSAAQGSAVRITGLTVRYGARETVAVDGLDLDVDAGEFLCVLGPTGCGKSTILNVVAGFIAPSGGAVLVDDLPVDGPGPSRGMVFQSFALFPWATALGNVAFGPRCLGKSKAEGMQIAQQHLELVGLADFGRAYPRELSGGMQQRVGLARALANAPSLLLLDEPFGSLDAQTRLEMQELLLRLWTGSQRTVVFVTHDVDEAILLADRIAMLTARPGRLKKSIPVGLPRPRSYDLVVSKEYMEIKRVAIEMIREEARKGRGESG